MRTMNRVIWILSVAVFICTAALPIDAVAGESEPSKEYMEVRDRIMASEKALSKIAELSKAQRQDRLEQLEALGQEVERKWRDTDVQAYARLTQKICGSLGSYNFMNRRNYYLAQSFAMRALEKADDMPLRVECMLLLSVQQTVDAEGKKIKGEALAQLRKRKATLWLHAWRRIEKTIDPNWNPNDPNDMPVENVSPPAASGLPAGIAPNAIKDPQLRAQYEAAIEANRQKNARHSQQLWARRLKKSWMPRAERLLIWNYMQAPDKSAELEALLKEYGVAQANRERMLNAVAAKKIPEELIRRPTTQPAK